MHACTDRQTDACTNRQTDACTDRQTDRCMHAQTDRQMHACTDRQTDACTDRQTDVHLSSVPVEDAVDVGMALVECVCEDVEPVLHVIPPALDGVHRCAAALVLPRLGELLMQHHLHHPALHHADGVAAGAQDGLHLEEAPDSQTSAEEQQSLRPQQQIARDPRQRTHARAHTHWTNDRQTLLLSSTALMSRAHIKTLFMSTLPLPKLLVHSVCFLFQIITRCLFPFKNGK